MSWSPPSSSDPAVTHYVVHAGQGSCPVTVDAKARSAVMPVVKGQRMIAPRVQAVNVLGDYVADALRAKYGTELALLTGGGIRDTFPARGYEPADPSLRRPSQGSNGPYDVTLGDALSLFPFSNSIMTTKVSGRNLWAALENGVSGYPSDGRFPQISGFRFAFDPTRPVGQRIISVTTDGRSIAADDTTYSLTTIDFLVNGGDDYRGRFSPESAVVRDVLADAFAAAVSADSAANGYVRIPALDGRITRVGWGGLASFVPSGEGVVWRAL